MDDVRSRQTGASIRRREHPLVPGPLVRHVHRRTAHHRAGPRWMAPDVQHEPLDRRDSFTATQRPPEDHVRGQGLGEQRSHIAVVRGVERGHERVDRGACRLFLHTPVIPAASRALVPQAAFRSRRTSPVAALERPGTFRGPRTARRGPESGGAPCTPPSGTRRPPADAIPPQPAQRPASSGWPPPATTRAKDQKCRSHDSGAERGVPPHDSHDDTRHRPASVTCSHRQAATSANTPT